MSETSLPDLAQLHPSIQRAVRAIPVSDRYFVALSGGLDSMALLTFALPHLIKSTSATIQIIHIHHGLSPFADEWANHCQAVCDLQGIACHIERVEVVTKGKGLEAAARAARYTVFERYLSDGGVLLQGHHQNDQAETVLMRLLRGAGPEGLSGIPQQRALSQGQLFRPWLALPRSLLEAEIKKYSVTWVEDESNADQQFDRNFLRHEVLPLLETRWPNVLNSMSRAASRSGETHEHLVSWCETELECVKSEHYTAEQALDLSVLSEYEDEQQRFLLRHWLDGLKVEHPSEKVFERIWTEMIPAEWDAQPALRWGENHLRRFNGCLFYLGEQAVSGEPYRYQVFGDENISTYNFSIGGRELNLSCEQWTNYKQGSLQIRVPNPDESVTVRSRNGGESIVFKGSTQNKSLKKILQAKKVAPWRRLHIPLIYYGDVLALVMVSPTEGIITEGFQANEEGSVLVVSWN